ncbi:ribonuclease H-like domain-containing protein [Tanacetum coccineum]
MEGVDRLNELKDEMLVNHIMYRLDCTTKEVIETTATISKLWKNLWTSLPHLIFSDIYDFTEMVVKETYLHDYIYFIDNTLNKCPTNLNLKKFKLDIHYSSLVNSEFKSRANSWIRYAIHRNVEEVDLWLFDVGVAQDFTLEDELFFNTSCITRMTLSCCRFNPPNGAISWERLECLCLFYVTLDEDMIEKILSRSPCLKSLELNYCHGFRRIDVSSKSVKELVFSEYRSDVRSEEDHIDCIKINAPDISSLTIKGELYLRELVLLNVSSLVVVNLKYSICYEEFVIFAEEIFRGLLESLGHVENITFGDHCSEVLSFKINVKMTLLMNRLKQRREMLERDLGCNVLHGSLHHNVEMRYVNGLCFSLPEHSVPIPWVKWSDVDCPKKVTNGIPTQNGNDGFELVTRKKQKAKQKPSHIEGIRLSKPKPNYVYRHVTKSHPVKTSTTHPNASTHPVNTSMDGAGEDIAKSHNKGAATFTNVTNSSQHTTDNDEEMNYVS